jgi:hypothetical protein
MTTTSMEAHILAVAQQFAREINKLEALKAGSQATIVLELKAPPSYSRESGNSLSLSCHFFDGRNHQTVTAASLGALMDEVHRRCGFADKQGMANDANEAALVALEAPEGYSIKKAFDSVPIPKE